MEKLGNINHLVGNDTMSTKKHDNVYDHERRPSSNEQKNNKEDTKYLLANRIFMSSLFDQGF